MKITIVKTFKDQEDTVVSSTSFDTRPHEGVTASTEKGTQLIWVAGNPDTEVVIRIPVVSETEVVEDETVPA